MKKYLLGIFAITTISVAIVFCQWWNVIVMDGFHIENGNHKVFEYGYPFKIVECTTIEGRATPQNQTPWKLAGNFLFFEVVGLIPLWGVKTCRTSGLNLRGQRPFLKAESFSHEAHP